MRHNLKHGGWLTHLNSQGDVSGRRGRKEAPALIAAKSDEMQIAFMRSKKSLRHRPLRN
jgi:hypothetical protein